MSDNHAVSPWGVYFTEGAGKMLLAEFYDIFGVAALVAETRNRFLFGG